MSFGEKFATPGGLVQRAFDRVAGNIHIPGVFARFKLRTNLYAAFREAHRAGDSRRAEADCATELDGHAWRWPFFDGAVAAFKTAGIRPHAWNEAELPPDLEWATLPEPVKVHLLVVTLETACFRLRDRENFMKMVRKKSLLPGWKQYLDRTYDGCPVERMMTERHSSAIERHREDAAIPPYFPYDGLALKTHIPKRRR